MSGNFSNSHTGKNGVSKDDHSSTDTTSNAQAVDQALSFESLSALMDDQADELELRRILKAMPNNAELVNKWQRFHTVRSSLQQEIHSRPAVNLLDGINARLSAESISLPKQATFEFSNPVVRYIVQGAVAASFFALTIMVTSIFNQSGTEIQTSVADAANLDTPVLGGEYKSSELSRTASLESSLDEEALARLRQAVHQEFSGNPAAPEIPVSYNLELPLDSTPNR